MRLYKFRSCSVQALANNKNLSVGVNRPPVTLEHATNRHWGSTLVYLNTSMLDWTFNMGLSDTMGVFKESGPYNLLPCHHPYAWSVSSPDILIKMFLKPLSFLWFYKGQLPLARGIVDKNQIINRKWSKKQRYIFTTKLFFTSLALWHL